MAAWSACRLFHSCHRFGPCQAMTPIRGTIAARSIGRESSRFAADTGGGRTIGPAAASISGSGRRPAQSDVARNRQASGTPAARGDNALDRLDRCPYPAKLPASISTKPPSPEFHAGVPHHPVRNRRRYDPVSAPIEHDDVNRWQHNGSRISDERRPACGSSGVGDPAEVERPTQDDQAAIILSPHSDPRRSGAPRSRRSGSGRSPSRARRSRGPRRGSGPSPGA